MAEKCTFGSRPDVDSNMLIEIIAREMKHFHNYKIYRPNFGSIPITGKFYARHDQLHSSSPREEQMIDDYFKHVTEARSLGPRTKNAEPVTENQCYGWYTEPLVPFDRNDKRFYFPMRESEHTKTEVIISFTNPKKKKKE